MLLFAPGLAELYFLRSLSSNALVSSSSMLAPRDLLEKARTFVGSIIWNDLSSTQSLILDTEAAQDEGILDLKASRLSLTRGCVRKKCFQTVKRRHLLKVSTSNSVTIDVDLSIPNRIPDLDLNSELALFGKKASALSPARHWNYKYLKKKMTFESSQLMVPAVEFH